MERILLPLPPVPSDSNDNLIENCIIGRFSFHRLVFLSIHCVPSSNCLSCTKYPSTSSSGCMQWKTHKRFRTHDSAIGLVWLTFPTNTHTHANTNTHTHTDMLKQYSCWCRNQLLIRNRIFMNHYRWPIGLCMCGFCKAADGWKSANAFYDGY